MFISQLVKYWERFGAETDKDKMGNTGIIDLNLIMALLDTTDIPVQNDAKVQQRRNSMTSTKTN